MNDYINFINTRRSTKGYEKDKQVPKELLEQIAEAGTWAPTGMNSQSPIILVVTDKETRDKLSELNARVLGSSEDPFYGAPCVMVVLSDKSVPTYLYNGSLVAENLMLAAHALDLGSCWIHRAKQVFEMPEGKEILAKLGVTGDYEGIANIVIGYPTNTLAPKPRKENYVYWVE